MRSLGARGTIPLVALALIGAPAGCGEDDPEPSPTQAADAPGAGGLLAWAIASNPGDLDPLRATTREAQLVTLQVHEPLVQSLSGPFGSVRRMPGLASASSSAANDTIWSFTLRQGVRFHDGSRFNAAAVVANAERWRADPSGRALMGDVFATDAPRPDLVRFFLEQPDPDFPERLSTPRTGIVSPRAIGPLGSSRLRRELRSGSGPFELRERDADSVLVARNLSWWGTARGLGPELDQVEFRVVADAEDRLALLQAGDVQVAERLGPGQARAAREDPLLDVLPGSRGSLAMQRSVRGITTARELPSLSGVWVTRVMPG
ncbi:MAG: ABC transporter substrate-binding protein [bacterium]